jgi:uncharacterized protein (TIGR03437 family)
MTKFILNPILRLFTPLLLLACAASAQSLTITTTSLPNGQVNQGYFTTFTAIGGTTPYTWSFLSGSLPAGISFSTNGSLVGTPTSSGNFTFTTRVTDAASNTANATLSVTISSSSLQIATTTLPNGALNQAYSQILSATGGTSPYAFSLDSGTLPSGITISPTGTLSGTPTTAGSFPFVARVTDNNLQSAVRSFTLVIAATSLVITTATVPTATINQPYNLSFAASGGASPYVYSLAQGAFPQGLSLAQNGVLSGTPVQSGAYTFTIRVTDANNIQATAPFTLNVITAGISFTTTSLPNGVISQTYNASLTATGGLTPYTFSVLTGTLPPGLTLAPATGLISGLPTTAGSYPITFRVADAANAAVTANLTILISSSATLSISTTSLPSGLINQSYFAQINSVGGTPPVTFAFLSGSVPIGISLTPNGGLTGTPTATGAFTFVIRATDAASATADRTLQLFINSTTLTITTTSLPNGTVGQNYTSTLSATGGTTPYSYALLSGNLPPGLNLLSNGTISGVPTTTGAYTFTTRATDTANNNTTATLTINIANAPLNITTTALPAAIVGASYNAGLSAAGGTPPYAFVLSTGNLPPGITLSNNGVFTGTPTATGSFSFTVNATDNAGATINAPLTLNVNSAGISISTSSLPIATLNTNYTTTLAVTGGSAPYTFSLIGGALPSGLSLAQNGTLSGAPTASGSFTFTVRVTDSTNSSAQATLALIVNSNLVSITTSTLPNAQFGVSYSASIVATGGNTPYTFSLISGSLPSGLTFAQNGTLSGIPTTTGNFALTIRVTDVNNSISQASFTLNVSSSNLTLTTIALPAGSLNQPYTFTLASTGGSGSYTYSVITSGLSTGNLPQGLTLASNGILSGTPLAAGTFPLTIRVTDSANNFVQSLFNLIINTTGLTISNTNLPTAQVNQPYTAALTAVGGSPQYTFGIISGSIPPGLQFSSNGTFSGTPTIAGSYPLTFRVTDAQSQTAQVSLTLTVSTTASGGLAITTTTLPAAQLNQPYTATLSASGGTAPYNFIIISGTVPNGLTLSTNGTLAGTPSASGTFSFTVRLTDAANTAIQTNFNLNVGGAPSTLALATTSLVNGAIGQFYNVSLSATGGTAPYSYSISNGSLPAGINLFANGTISGTPTANGGFQFSVRVTDSAFNTVVATLNLSIGASNLAITTTNVPNGAVSQPYNALLTATGGTAPYVFVITGGTVPNGLSLSTQGIFSGIPNSTGFFSLTVRVTDSNLNTAQASFSFSVTTGPAISVTNASLPNGRVNQPYSQTLNVTGGQAPYSFTTLSGVLPPGITLASNGLLSGTPSQGGTYNFTVRLTDANVNAINVPLTITITTGGPAISTTSLPNGNVGTPYNFTVQASTTTPGASISFSLSNGSLPAGLNISSSGIISGIPTTAGASNFTVRASDSTGAFTEVPLTLTIAQSTGPLAISSAAPPNGQLYYSYSFPLIASGGIPAYNWTLTSGSVPNGLRLDSTGTLSGTLLASGVYRFTVRVTDQTGNGVDAVYNVEVTRARRLPTAQVGFNYSTIDSTPGARLPVSYSLATNALGALPPGINLSSDGTFSGNPSTPGEYTFGVTVRDANNATLTSTLTLLVLPNTSVFHIPTTYLPGGSVSAPYSQTLATANGQAPFNWSLNSGTLPTGITLNPLTGVLSGTPSATTTTFFTVRVTDRTGLAATASFALTIAAAGSPVVSSVSNAASYNASGVAPGELLVIFGANMGPQNLQTFTLTNNIFPNSIAATRVLIEGNPVPLIYSASGQVSAIAPFNLLPGATVNIIVEYNNQQSAAFTMPVVSALPGLFTLNSSGTGPGAILNQNNSVNQQSNPAAKDSIIVLYATGGGQMTPPGQDGRVADAASSLSQGVTVTINGVPAEILYAGNAPGLVQGVIQVNLRLPANTPSGAIPVILRVGQNSSNPNVTVWVQ